MGCDLPFIPNVAALKDDQEWSTVGHPNEPATAILYQGAPANRH